jgi:hypothetical protein
MCLCISACFTIPPFKTTLDVGHMYFNLVLMDVVAETSKDVAAVNIEGRLGGKHRRTSRRKTSKAAWPPAMARAVGRAVYSEYPRGVGRPYFARNRYLC